MTISVDTAGVITTHFFNKSTRLFPEDGHLQDPSSAISAAAHRRLLKDLLRRIYRTCSTLDGFTDAIRQTTVGSIFTQSTIVRAARDILTRTLANRYGLTQMQIDTLTL